MIILRFILFPIWIESNFNPDYFLNKEEVILTHQERLSIPLGKRYTALMFIMSVYVDEFYDFRCAPSVVQKLVAIKHGVEVDPRNPRFPDLVSKRNLVYYVLLWEEEGVYSIKPTERSYMLNDGYILSYNEDSRLLIAFKIP